MDTIVITGATSMLGIATLRAALDDGVKRIYAVVRADSLNNDRLPKDDRIIKVECDLGEYDLLKDRIKEKCEAFYHFAWEPSQKEKSLRFYDVETGYRNMGYFLQAYQAAFDLQCKNFVGAGSQAEYGDLRQDIQRPEDMTNPITSYGIAKDMTRRMLMIKSREYAVNVQWVRIFSVYGTLDRKDTLISSVLAKLVKDTSIDLTECIQMWDYLFESDAGRAIYFIGKDSKQSDIYCLGSGKAKRLKEYIVEMKEIVGSKSELHFGQIPYSKGAVMSLQTDITKIIENTGWDGPGVDFEEGIKAILKSLK